MERWGRGGEGNRRVGGPGPRQGSAGEVMMRDALAEEEEEGEGHARRSVEEHIDEGEDESLVLGEEMSDLGTREEC